MDKDSTFPLQQDFLLGTSGKINTQKQKLAWAVGKKELQKSLRYNQSSIN